MQSNKLKSFFFWIFSYFGLSRRRAVILMYHSLRTQGPFFSVRPDDFEWQMHYLSRNRIPVVRLSELVRRLRAREPLGGAVAITFDDGYQDNYTLAFPILQRYGFPATIFMVAGMIGKRNDAHEYLSDTELKEMQSSGQIEVASHTMTHPKLATVSRHEAFFELGESKRVLEQLLAMPVPFIAYPKGNFSEETISVARECGYEAAVTVREGTVAEGDDLLRLPRVSIDSTTSAAQFRGKITRAADLYGYLRNIRI
jgi:peptidoglycan/xylan/chitin deacetylase (PgdA/CDA1 family)